MSYSLINIYEASGQTLFDDIELYELIDKDILVNTIFDEAGELEPVTSYPSLLKSKINVFFKRYYTNFKHLYDAYLLEYEPIENYDRHSEITLTDTGTVKDTGKGDQTQTPNLTNKTTGTDVTERTPNLTNKTNGTETTDRTPNLKEVADVSNTETPNTTTENTTSAFNSVAYLPKDKQTVTGDTTSKGNTTTTTTGNETVIRTPDLTETQTGSETVARTPDLTETQTGTNKIEDSRDYTQTTDLTHKTVDHTHGNIGVTTSQQMLQSEVDLWIRYNVYKAMADMFIRDLMITVF